MKTLTKGIEKKKKSITQITSHNCEIAKNKLTSCAHSFWLIF